MQTVKTTKKPNDLKQIDFEFYNKTRSSVQLLSKIAFCYSFKTSAYVVAKVYWRIKYTLAPKFEANVYFSPKLQTWRLMCTLPKLGG